MKRTDYNILRRARAKERRLYRALTFWCDDPRVYLEYKPMKDAFELTGYVRYKGENYRLDYEFGVEEPLQTIHQLRLKIWDDLEWAHQQRQNHRLGLPSSPA